MTGVIALITALAQTTHELLKKFPDYDEKKRKKWNEIERIYNNEMNNPEENWDMDLILNMRDEILRVNQEIVKAVSNE